MADQSNQGFARSLSTSVSLCCCLSALISTGTKGHGAPGHLTTISDKSEILVRDSLNKVHFCIRLAFDIIAYSAQMIITSMDVHTMQVISGGNANIWAFLPVLRTVSIPWASGLFDVGGGPGLRLL